MAIPIIPGVDQYLSEGIKSLGDTISLFTETDRKTQRAIRNMLIENPDLIQDFADVEAKAPGSLQKLGFGKVADMVSEVSPSLALQREQRLGGRALDIEEQELAIREFKNNAVLAEIQRDPTLSALQLDALISEQLGIPTSTELRRGEVTLIPLEMQAQRAQLIMNAVEQGQDVSGAIIDFVHSFREGQDDPQVTASILAHPLLGPQFESLMELENFRESAELQRELAQLRISTSNGSISAAMQREVAMIQDMRGTVSQIRNFLAERPNSVGLKFIGPEMLNARLDPDGVRLRAEIASLNSTLFHLRSGTAVTANEKTRLEPLTPNKFDTAEAIYEKLNGLERFFDDYVRNRQNVGGTSEEGTTTSITGPNEVVQELIDGWVLEGLNNAQIREKLKNFRLIDLVERGK